MTPRDVLAILRRTYGPQPGWWPVDRAWHASHGTDWRLEVCVGAILTQNTTWRGVEVAIAGLKDAGLLSAEALAGVPTATLEDLVRPAGTYRSKARYLQALARAIQAAGGFDPFVAGPLDAARARLLQVPGIGHETADAILLYAAGRPAFVIDAYTRRVGDRLGLTGGRERYDELARVWSTSSTRTPKAYQQAHALIVEHAKRTCLARHPSCGSCALSPSCARVGVADRTPATRRPLSAASPVGSPRAAAVAMPSGPRQAARPPA